MGWIYEVLAWMPSAAGGYADQTYYQGDSFIQMLLAVRKAKKDGSGCVKVYLR